MPASQNSSDSGMQRRQPIWPWLLMPLATLAVYFALHNAKREPAHAEPLATSTEETVATASPSTESKN